MNTKFKRESFNQLSCMYSWVLKKNIRISSLYGLILMLLNLGITILQKSANSSDTAIIAASILDTTVPVLIFTLILSGIVFSYMHKKRSVDLFNSLPVSRTSMLLGGYFAGLTLIIVPFILVSAVSIYLTFSIPGITAILLRNYIFLILTVIASFTFSAFIAVCSGTTIDMMISIFLISGSAPASIVLSSMIAGIILPGYGVFNNIPGLSLIAFSPYISAAYPFLCPSNTRFFIWFIPFCLLFLGLTIILNKKRKSEVAEEPFALPVLVIIIRFLASLVIGIAVGLILYVTLIANIPINNNNHVLLIISVIISSFCAHLIIDAIYSRGLRNIGKGLKYYFIMLAAFLAFYSSLCFGFFGYDSRIPKVDDIDNISIFVSSYEDGCSDSHEYLIEDGSLVKLDPKLNEQESINTFLDFHSSAVSDIKAKNYPYVLASNNENANGNINITYNLKNGKQLIRTYAISSLGETSLKKLTEITYLPEYKREAMIVFNITSNDLSNFYISNESSSEEINNASSEQKDQLISALQKDILNDTAEKRYVYNLSSNKSQTKITLFSYPEQYDNPDMKRVTFFDPTYLIPDYYTNTWSLINNNSWFNQ